MKSKIFALALLAAAASAFAETTQVSETPSVRPVTVTWGACVESVFEKTTLSSDTHVNIDFPFTQEQMSASYCGQFGERVNGKLVNTGYVTVDDTGTVLVECFTAVPRCTRQIGYGDDSKVYWRAK